MADYRRLGIMVTENSKLSGDKGGDLAFLMSMALANTHPIFLSFRDINLSS